MALLAFEGWYADVRKELRNGYGRHIYYWPESERMQKEISFRRAFFVVELFFHTAITICKLSVYVNGFGGKFLSRTIC